MWPTLRYFTICIRTGILCRNEIINRKVFIWNLKIISLSTYVWAYISYPNQPSSVLSWWQLRLIITVQTADKISGFFRNNIINISCRSHCDNTLKVRPVMTVIQPINIWWNIECPLFNTTMTKIQLCLFIRKCICLTIKPRFYIIMKVTMIAFKLTIRIAALFELLSWLRRTRLPSMAITFPFVKEDKSLTQFVNIDQTVHYHSLQRLYPKYHERVFHVPVLKVP